ncbi:unnamed protein product [Camellia sinensis]
MTSNLIRLGSSLSPISKPNSWLSPSGLFAFGFYPEKNEFAVGIWILGHPNNTLVWTANPDYPPVSSNSTIEFTRDEAPIVAGVIIPLHNCRRCRPNRRSNSRSTGQDHPRERTKRSRNQPVGPARPRHNSNRFPAIITQLQNQQQQQHHRQKEEKTEIKSLNDKRRRKVNDERRALLKLLTNQLNASHTLTTLETRHYVLEENESESANEHCNYFKFTDDDDDDVTSTIHSNVGPRTAIRTEEINDLKRRLGEMDNAIHEHGRRLQMMEKIFK